MTDGATEPKPAPNWGRLSIGGFTLAAAVLWRFMERLDVLDGTLSLLSRIGPLLAANWEVLAAAIGLTLIVQEIGRSRQWWSRLGGRRSRSEKITPPNEAPPQTDAPALPSTPPPPQAPPEGVERLREAYRSFVQPAVGYAHEILLTEAGVNAGQGRDWELHVARLIREYVIPRHIKNKEEFENRLNASQPLTQAEFSGLLGLFRLVLIDYLSVAHEFITARGLFIGREALATDHSYVELRRRHARCLEELRRLRGRSDTKPATDMIYLELQQLFPPNPA